MSKNNFESLLYTITANTVYLIMKNTGWSEDVAFERFVHSKVYSLLEREETKVWHYSSTMLASLFEEERAGKSNWSEVALLCISKLSALSHIKILMVLMAERQ